MELFISFNNKGYAHTQWGFTSESLGQLLSMNIRLKTIPLSPRCVAALFSAVPLLLQMSTDDYNQLTSTLASQIYTKDSILSRTDDPHPEGGDHSDDINQEEQDAYNERLQYF